mmetsp:Transcript_6716/g.27809  ORF Transcript_6716/g.27809 Transcript_6716/m.27809 type:complete len:248 (+) Transcript_6716:322-1065(+)
MNPTPRPSTAARAPATRAYRSSTLPCASTTLRPTDGISRTSSMDSGGGEVLTAALETSAANARALAIGRRRLGSIGVMTLVAMGDTPPGTGTAPDCGVGPDLAVEAGEAGVDCWTGATRPSVGLAPLVARRALTASISADARCDAAAAVFVWASASSTVTTQGTPAVSLRTILSRSSALGLFSSTNRASIWRVTIPVSSSSSSSSPESRSSVSGSGSTATVVAYSDPGMDTTNFFDPNGSSQAYAAT